MFYNGWTFSETGRIMGTDREPANPDDWVGGIRFRSADGSARVSLATTPTSWPNGFPSVDGDGVCFDKAAAIDHWQNGIPFTAVGRIATDLTEPIAYWQNGLPFTAAGRLCTEEELVIVHPVAFSSGFSNAFF